MSRVTIKYVIDFYDTHREYFANYITKEIYEDLVMNFDKSPAELLDGWNEKRARGHHMGLTKEQFEHYYPNVDFNKRHEIGEVMTPAIVTSEDSENEQTVPIEIPVEQTIQEQINQYVPDNEAEQLVNEINDKADTTQNVIGNEFTEESVPVENESSKAPIKIIEGTDLHDKPLCIYFVKDLKQFLKISSQQLLRN